MGGMTQEFEPNSLKTTTQIVGNDCPQIEQGLKELIGSLDKINTTLSHPSISWIEKGSFFVSFVTIVLLYVYTKYTYRIAKANEELLKPSISYSLISGKNFYPDATREQLYETRFILKNHSKHNVVSFVRLNLKADEKNIRLDESAYTGGRNWFLLPEQEINGHFVIPEQYRNKKIIMEPEIRYSVPNGKQYKIPKIKWYFNEKTGQWKNSIGVAV